jgi:hypothetical protein
VSSDQILKEPSNMKFEESLKKMKEHFAVARKDWVVDGFLTMILTLQYGEIKEHELGGVFPITRKWIPTQNEILAEDWSLCQEDPKGSEDQKEAIEP